MVYVINSNGQPLMPTRRYGKVRRLLKVGMAKVVRRCPFTIKLLYEAEENVQPVVLGVDAGSKHVGFSACTDFGFIKTKFQSFGCLDCKRILNAGPNY